MCDFLFITKRDWAQLGATTSSSDEELESDSDEDEDSLSSSCAWMGEGPSLSL